RFSLGSRLGRRSALRVTVGTYRLLARTLRLKCSQIPRAFGACPFVFCACPLAFRACAFALPPLALVVRADRFEERNIPLLLRLPSLPRCSDKTRQKCKQSCQCGADGEAVTPHKLASPVSKRVGTRSHRLMIKIAAQILAERGCRRIALGGPLLQCLGHDVVEIAAQGPRELMRDGTACMRGP